LLIKNILLTCGIIKTTNMNYTKENDKIGDRIVRATQIGNCIGKVSNLAMFIENILIPKVENRNETYYDRADISRDLNEVLEDLKELKDKIDKIEL